MLVRKTLINSLFVSTAIVAVPAFAQDQAGTDTEAASSGQSGNQIVVTAQKFEQRAQDVPITISAVGGERIRELGVTDLDELSNYVPGLNIQEQSANNPGIVIRGITSDSGSAQQGPRVSLYYNGVDISRSRGSYQGIYDLDRVEVIKGPQATLFGTASAIGAISMVSARPREGFSAELSGGYGNFDAVTLGGHINGGSDVVAARLAFDWKKRDGYVENLAASQEDELYAQDNLGLRGSVRLTPNDALMIDLVATYDRSRNGGTPFISGTFATANGPADPFGDANLGGSPFSLDVLGKDQLGLDRNVYDLNATIDLDLGGGWSFTTVNGYREFDNIETFDADGSAAFFLEFAEIAEGQQFSHEGRFAYSGDSIRASAGWNIFVEDGFQSVPFSTEEGVYLQCAAGLIPDLPCVADDGTVSADLATGFLTGGLATFLPYSSVFENRGENDAYSVFADATWLASDAFELTAGVRYLWETRGSAYTADQPNSVITGAPLLPVVSTNGQVFEAEDDFDTWLPRVNALVRVSNGVNIYATVSKGRRSPVVSLESAAGADGEPIADLQLIPQEIVWNYEGGVKIATGPVSASLGVYYQDYSGFQVNVVQDDGSIDTESAGNATNLGIEAELAVTPTNWLTIFANGAYIDAKIDESDELAAEFSGARFRLQPKFQAAAGFTVDTFISDTVRFFATPSVTHRSKLFFELPNDDGTSQGAVTLVNARAGFSFSDEMFEIAGFIRNATNEDYLLDAGNTGGAFEYPTFIPAEPRFFGVEFTVRTR